MNPAACTACTDREAQLESLLFGELDRAAEAALREHVEHCRGCREALDDAQVAFAALSDVSEAPLPYGDRWSEPAENADGERSEKAWIALKRRLEPPAPAESPARAHRAYELVAMAAVLVIGIGLGRLDTPPSAGLTEIAAVENLDISPEALLALERAELLSDVGVRYVALRRRSPRSSRRRDGAFRRCREHRRSVPHPRARKRALERRKTPRDRTRC